VLAGLAAEGRTRISNVVFIDRGYENICAKLQGLGAAIDEEEEDRHDCPIESAGDPIEWGMAPYSVAAK